MTKLQPILYELREELKQNHFKLDGRYSQRFIFKFPVIVGSKMYIIIFWPITPVIIAIEYISILN